MKTMIKTFDNDMYLIEDSTPADIMEEMKTLDYVQMPNGSMIHKKSISAIQTYEDYLFQTDQRARHKKGQFLAGGKWHDQGGEVASAELERILGSKEEVKRIEHDLTEGMRLPDNNER